MTLTSNPQLELAFDFVQNTNRNIFLTGKAGTGKTTFLHKVKSQISKRAAVVAPTGVAAINARGMTIHSLFQLPFGPYLPGVNNELSRKRRFSGKKINLIKSLDLVIIDEISMVRSDVLDSIDEVLRRYKDFTKPFGGVQLLMIGDLHQLPPVVRNEEWQLLSQYYKTPYFFGSLALQKSNPITIELKHIYRQSDDIFIKLLNKVRNNLLDKEVLDTLNSRYIKDFQPSEEEPYITLTSHNNSANTINQEQLGVLKGKAHKFLAEIKGDFPQKAYPTAEVLEFKVGAQVLFIKNDISQEKRYYNGKIGQITKIEKEIIHVKCPGDYDAIEVAAVEWSNVKYTLNEKTKEVDEEVKGTFTQHPLKLAWAITIHKSQGLTFERAIIDAQSAFAHGQVYVALSRCTSFEGIVLRSKLAYNSVKTDSVVKRYATEAEKNAPDEAELEKSKRAYQESLVRDLFNYQQIERSFNGLNRVYMEHENTLTTAARSQVTDLFGKTEMEIFAVAQKFQPHLHNYFLQPELPENNKELQARLKKAIGYFEEKLQKEIIPELKKVQLVTDNKEVKKKANKQLKSLEKELFIKKACLAISKETFSVQNYFKAKNNADVDFEKANQSGGSKSKYSRVPKSAPYPELYLRLDKWRTGLSFEYEVTPYDIVTSKIMIEITKFLPTDSAALKRIKGLGTVRVKQYGAEIIEIIEKFCAEKGIPSNLLTAASAKPSKASKPKKPNTKVVSFDLYKSGKTVAEIAKERSLTPGTINGHLAHFIALGELDIFELLDAPKVAEMEAYFKGVESPSFTEAKIHFKDKYGYGEMRLVVNYLKSQE